MAFWGVSLGGDRQQPQHGTRAGTIEKVFRRYLRSAVLAFRENSHLESKSPSFEQRTRAHSLLDGEKRFLVTCTAGTSCLTNRASTSPGVSVVALAEPHAIPSCTASGMD